MNKIYLIANWKMQLSLKESIELAESLKQWAQNSGANAQSLELILCPSFTALSEVGKILKDTPIKLGAQDLFYHQKGSYTGEVSALELKELDVEYVIVGHSERREYQKETDEEVNRKVLAALKNNLRPILCVGEKFEERQMGKKDLIVIKQVVKSLEDVSLGENQEVIIAYEPVWVIGSGQAVSKDEAEHTAWVIKHALLDLYSPQIIDRNFSIIYGGSVDEKCIKDFIIPGLLEGVLIGGASLKAEKFIRLVNQLGS